MGALRGVFVYPRTACPPRRSSSGSNNTEPCFGYSLGYRGCVIAPANGNSQCTATELVCFSLTRKRPPACSFAVNDNANITKVHGSSYVWQI